LILAKEIFDATNIAHAWRHYDAEFFLLSMPVFIGRAKKLMTAINIDINRFTRSRAHAS